MFYARLKLGLLDPAAAANPYARIPRSAANSAEHRALALQARPSPLEYP